MTEKCPNCDRGNVGSQIVELSHPLTEAKYYGIICSNCGVIYHSKGAEEQIEKIND